MRATRNTTRFWLAPIIMLAATSCGVSAKDEAIAATRQFHQHYNNQQFDSIVEDATDGLQATMPEEVATQLFGGIHSAMGIHQSSELVDWSITTSTTRGQKVRLVLLSQFEKDSATEIFEYQLSGQFVLLASYENQPSSWN